MGGSGCICPESTILRTLITHILLRRDEVVLLDMYAASSISGAPRPTPSMPC